MACVMRASRACRAPLGLRPAGARSLGLHRAVRAPHAESRRLLSSGVGLEDQGTVVDGRVDTSSESFAQNAQAMAAQRAEARTPFPEARLRGG